MASVVHVVDVVVDDHNATGSKRPGIFHAVHPAEDDRNVADIA